MVVRATLDAVACWASWLRVADANRLNKLIGKTSDVVGTECDSLTVSERKTLMKLRTILDSVSHPLHDVLVRYKRTFSERLILMSRN